jgi:hypothetical protein
VEGLAEMASLIPSSPVLILAEEVLSFSLPM